MKKEKEILRLGEHKHELEKLNSSFGQLNQNLLGLGLDHANKIAGNLSDRIIYNLRDSVNYRYHCVYLHLQIMLRLYNETIHKLNTRFGEKDFMPPMVMGYAAEDQFAVFDSILFHGVSMFDYIGNMIEYVCGGEKRRRLKWNGVVRSVRDEKNEMSKLPIASSVLDINRELIDKLYQHRSDVIHLKPHFGGADLTLDFTSETFDLGVYTPRPFTKKFKELDTLTSSYHITLHYTVFWLANRLLEAANRLVSEIRTHIEENRKIPEGQEPIQFVDEKP